MYPSKVSQLYREEAIRHLNTPDRGDYHLKPLMLSKWMWLLAVLMVLSGILVWSLYASLIISVHGRGIVVSGDQIRWAEKNFIDLANHKRQIADQLKMLYVRKSDLYEKHYLTLDDLLRAKKEYLSAKEEVDLYFNPLLFSRSEQLGDQFQVLVFISQKDSVNVEPGELVHLKIMNNVGHKELDKIGEVSWVFKYPVSKKLVNAYLKNIDLVDDLFSSGPPVLVKVNFSKLLGMKDIVPGEMLSAKIIIKHISPFNLVMQATA